MESRSTERDDVDEPVISEAVNALAEMDKTFKSHLGGTYRGSVRNLVSILNPHVANWLKAKTNVLKKNLKKMEGIKCSNTTDCRAGENKILWVEAAHPLDASRPQVIKAVVKDYLKRGGNGCDIGEVFKEVKSRHETLKFAFLCRWCHKEHDKLSDGSYIAHTFKEWADYAATLKKKKQEETITNSSPNELESALEVPGRSSKRSTSTH